MRMAIAMGPIVIPSLSVTGTAEHEQSIAQHQGCTEIPSKFAESETSNINGFYNRASVLENK